ncbi:hypothetical protein HDV02_004795 [Globomyces sp. JEL0801]|nr:hypothetical protein HDV02_004795 [Globomyces sp. JEL0801]
MTRSKASANPRGKAVLLLKECRKRYEEDLKQGIKPFVTDTYLEEVEERLAKTATKPPKGFWIEQLAKLKKEVAQEMVRRNIANKIKTNEQKQTKTGGEINPVEQNQTETETEAETVGKKQEEKTKSTENTDTEQGLVEKEEKEE